MRFSQLSAYMYSVQLSTSFDPFDGPAALIESAVDGRRGYGEQRRVSQTMKSRCPTTDPIKPGTSNLGAYIRRRLERAANQRLAFPGVPWRASLQLLHTLLPSGASKARRSRTRNSTARRPRLPRLLAYPLPDAAETQAKSHPNEPSGL